MNDHQPVDICINYFILCHVEGVVLIEAGKRRRKKKKNPSFLSAYCAGADENVEDAKDSMWCL